MEALELTVCGDSDILGRSIQLVGDLQHHLFDTLYHSVALERDATLVTADQPYARTAGALGQIIHLDEITLNTTDGAWNSELTTPFEPALAKPAIVTRSISEGAHVCRYQAEFRKSFW